MMSHHGVIISVKPNERQTADLLLEQKFFEFHTARFTIFQSKGLSGLASLGECPHPNVPYEIPLNDIIRELYLIIKRLA